MEGRSQNHNLSRYVDCSISNSQVLEGLLLHSARCYGSIVVKRVTVTVPTLDRSLILDMMQSLELVTTFTKITSRPLLHWLNLR